MMYSNVIAGSTVSRGSFVFSQSRVKVSAGLTDVGSLAVGAFDLVNCSLSVVGLWATLMLLGCRILEMVSEVPLI